METPLRYNPALDGLRAIAIMLVIATHCYVPGLAGGYFGVDLFFVLSGFLITRLLVDEFGAHGRIDLPGFYLRRMLRLSPPLMLMLIAYLAVAPTLWPQYDLSTHVGDAALAGFYLADYARAFWLHPKVLGHSWSLAVEEHFYLVWPFAVLLLTRFKWRTRIALLIGLYLLTTAWRVFEYERLGWDAAYFRFDTRTSGLVLGSLLGIGLPRLGKIPEGTANAAGFFACAVLFGCLGISGWEAPWDLTWTLCLVEIAAAALIVAASVQRSWVSALLSAPPLVGLGIISYGVYLWHYPAALVLRGVLPWYETLPLVLAFSLAAATASYLIVERPLQRYRRGLMARRRGTAGEKPVAEPVRAIATTVS